MNGELATTSSDRAKTEEDLKGIKVVEEVVLQKKKKKKRKNKSKRVDPLPDVLRSNMSDENTSQCVVNGNESAIGPKENDKDNSVVTEVSEVRNDAVNGKIDVKEENSANITSGNKESDAANNDIEVNVDKDLVKDRLIWADDVETGAVKHDQADTITTETKLAKADVDATNNQENGEMSDVSKLNEEGPTADVKDRKLQWNVEAEPWLPRTQSKPVDETGGNNKDAEVNESNEVKPNTPEGNQRLPVVHHRSSPRQRNSSRFRPSYDTRIPVIPPFPFGDGRFIGGLPSYDDFQANRFLVRPPVRGTGILPNYPNMLPRQIRGTRGIEGGRPARSQSGRGSYRSPSPQSFNGRSPEAFRSILPNRCSTRRYSSSRSSAEPHAIPPQNSNDTPLPTSAYVGQNLHFNIAYDPPVPHMEHGVHSQQPYFAYGGHHQPLHTGYEGHPQPPHFEPMEHQPRPRLDYGGYPQPPYMEYGQATQAMPMMLGAVQQPLVYVAPNESVGQLSPAPVECPVVYVCPNTVTVHAQPGVQPEGDNVVVGYPPGYDRMIFISSTPSLFLQVNH